MHPGRCARQAVVPLREDGADVVAQRFQLGDPLLDLPEFAGRQSARLRARRVRGATLLHELRDLLDREAEPQRGADDSNALDGSGRKPSVPVR